jgi:hypothetical protein
MQNGARVAVVGRFVLRKPVGGFVASVTPRNGSSRLSEFTFLNSSAVHCKACFTTLRV